MRKEIISIEITFLHSLIVFGNGFCYTLIDFYKKAKYILETWKLEIFIAPRLSNWLLPIGNYKLEYDLA